MKILQYILLFVILVFSSINVSFASEKIDVYAHIVDIDWTAYNYLYVYIQNWDNILCQWKTRQNFENIILKNGKTTDILKVKESWSAFFSCDKDKVLWTNGKIKPNLKVLIKSDWFYRINNGSIILPIGNFWLTDDTIIIGWYKQANFKVKIEQFNNRLYNKYDKNIDKYKVKREIEIKHEEALEDSINDIKEVKLSIVWIPENIDNVIYYYKSMKYKYNKWSDNIIVMSSNTIDILKIWNKILTNIEIPTNNILELKYIDDFNIKEIQFSLILKNKPVYTKEVVIYIDWEKSIYKEWNSYNLTSKQIINGFNLKINNKSFWLIKLNNNDNLEIDYNKIIKDSLDLEDLNNKTLSIKLPITTLDALWRLVYTEVLMNGWNNKKIIRSDKIFKDWSTFIVIEFLEQWDMIPKYIIIQGVKYNLIDISLNYEKFIKKDRK